MVCQNAIANKAHQEPRGSFRQNKHGISIFLLLKDFFISTPIIEKQDSTNSRKLAGDMKKYVRAKYLFSVNSC